MTESIVTSELPDSTGALAGSEEAVASEKARSLLSDAWRDLRHNWLFWFASVLAVVFAAMAIAPGLFTSIDPRACELSKSLQSPSGEHWFGTNLQGCDVYSRTIYGARASIEVGLFATLLSGLIALVVGLTAGFYGRWLDAILSRTIDVVLGIPLLLAALVASRAFYNYDFGIWSVVVILGILGWTTSARVVRSSVISAKQQDYVQAARMLGAGSGRIILRHILPNAIAPMIVVLTIALGIFISVEATLSFLGAGLKPPTISWGIDISDSSQRVRNAPWALLFPAGFLATTVLAFIMLGDAVREAFDPKLR